jgi:hypothetical protein
MNWLMVIWNAGEVIEMTDHARMNFKRRPSVSWQEWALMITFCLLIFSELAWRL